MPSRSGIPGCPFNMWSRNSGIAFSAISNKVLGVAKLPEETIRGFEGRFARIEVNCSGVITRT